MTQRPTTAGYARARQLSYTWHQLTDNRASHAFETAQMELFSDRVLTSLCGLGTLELVHVASSRVTLGTCELCLLRAIQ